MTSAASASGPTPSCWAQTAHRVRLEWGPAGAARLTSGATGPLVCVVVDVLSFTTSLSVAADRGVAVHPHPWRDDSARALAARLGATLAVGRSVADHGAVSLSPVSIRRATTLERLVLPSPNGSSIAHLLGATGAVVVGACLRNRAAVGAHLAGLLDADPTSALVLVPAGERWPDDTLRPAVEDLWGAGGVVAALLDVGVVEPGEVSEEARAADAAYRGVVRRLAEALLSCASGVELRRGGWADDVAVAAELDASGAVPVLGADGAFVAAGAG